MPGRQRVTYEVACLFLLLWACLIAHQGRRCFCKGARKYNTPASNKRQVPFFCLLLAFLSCTWPFMGWRFVAGSTFCVCRGCSIWIFFRNGDHVALTTRTHVKSCSFSWRESSTLMFLVLLTCVHLKFSSRRTSRVALEYRLLGIPPALLPFKSRNKDRKGTFLLGGCRGLSRLLVSVVLGYLQSLQEVWSFRVDFGSQVVLPPHRRWDLRTRKLHASGRKPLRERFICQRVWRCTAHRDVSQLKIVQGSCCSSLVDEVASMSVTMQSLLMPWRASANATGLFVWPGEVVQMRCNQSTLTWALRSEMHLKTKDWQNRKDWHPADLGLTRRESFFCCLRWCPERRWRHFDSRRCEPDKCLVEVQVGDA